MNGLPYYKAYPRDFFEGTRMMGFELKAAYRLLLDLIYMHGGALEDDPRFISGQMGCSVKKWNLIRSDLIKIGKIRVIDNSLRNLRADKELEILRRFQDKQAENASGPRKNNGLDKAMAEPKPSHTEPDTDTDKKKEEYDAQERLIDFPPPEKPPPKARLPSDWALPDVGWEYARSKMKLRDDEIKEMADEFHIYWTDRADAGGKKSCDGWRATWQGHVRRNAAQYIRNRNMAGKAAPGGYGQGSSIASIVARRHAAG